jgi:hypothetical protein
MLRLLIDRADARVRRARRERPATQWAEAR